MKNIHKMCYALSNTFGDAVWVVAAVGGFLLPEVICFGTAILLITAIL